MMILNETGQTMRLVCAFGLLAAGFSTAKADRRYEVKGSEFDLTGKLVGDQVGARLAIGDQGGYLVWQDNATDESGLGVSALVLDANAVPVGAPVRLNSNLLGNQEKPRLGLLNGGGALFAWETGESGFRRVQYRLMDKNHLFIGPEAFVTSANSGEQTNPSLTVLGNGVSVLAWSQLMIDGRMKEIVARFISHDSKKIGSEFSLNDFTSGNQSNVSLLSLPENRFAAVWVSDSRLSDNSLDVVAKVFTSDGNALTEEVILNIEGVCGRPKLALIGDQKMVAIWDQFDATEKQRNNSLDIWGVTLDFNLKKTSGVYLVNQTRLGDQFSPQLEGADKGVMVVWNSLGQDGSREGVVGRFIGQDSGFASDEFVVNSKKYLGQVQPTVSANSKGDFLVAWSDPGPGGLDLHGQRYKAIDGDTDSVELAPIDGVYVNALSDSELLISWPNLSGMGVKRYQVYIDDIAIPKSVTENWFIWRGLRSGSEYAFRVSYVLQSGRESVLSNYSLSRTWGRDLSQDNLPDDWQLEYFGRDRSVWPGPELDSDNDGATNFEEFLAGTNPSDSDSKLELSIVDMETGQRLTWKAEPGSVYQLQQSGAIGSSNNWINFGRPLVASENVVGLSMEAVADIAFYRVIRIR